MKEGNSTSRDVSRRHRQESGPAAWLLNRDRDMSGAVGEPAVLSAVRVRTHIFAGDRLHAIEFVQQATAFVIADSNSVSILIPLHDPASIIELLDHLINRKRRTAHRNEAGLRCSNTLALGASRSGCAHGRGAAQSPTDRYQPTQLYLAVYQRIASVHGFQHITSGRSCCPETVASGGSLHGQTHLTNDHLILGRDRLL